MPVIRTLVVCAATLASFAAPAGAASTCTDSWMAAAGGSWFAAADWSTGKVPSPSDDVCITTPGTYTVTLAPTSGSDGGTVNSLTLGGSSGSQTLDISGQASVSTNNETQNTTTLALTLGGTLSTSGTLVLDATGGGTPTAGGAAGGDAVLISLRALTNGGRIETQVEDKAWQAYVSGTVVNERAGRIAVNSGRLALPSPSTSGYGAANAFAVTNDGSLTVAAAASVSLSGGIGAAGTFTNDGQLVNRGSLTATQAGGPFTWIQSGGSISGNPVVLQSGAQLVDSAGAGQFLFNLGGGALTGKIPAGQTVTVEGAAYNYQGNNFNGTALTLTNPAHASPAVVNDGTVVLDAPGKARTSGGPASLASGMLLNDGTLVSHVEDSAWTNALKVGLVNEHSGRVSVGSGELDASGAAVINHGLATVAPGAQWALDEGASFANKRDGTIALEISSTTRLGSFQLTSPCCVGPGQVTAGGTLSPVLQGRYVPAAGTDFPLFALDGGKFAGTFATVSGRFTADYAHETASPAFAGAIYLAKKPGAKSPKRR